MQEFDQLRAESGKIFIEVLRIRKRPGGQQQAFGDEDDPTMFDARCTRFLGVNYKELVKRTLQGGSDEEILDWCFEHGRRPSQEEIEIWNAFLVKRGWRDAGSADLQAAKQRAGWGNRDDIQTWVDLHDAEEGRQPRAAGR